MSGELYVRYDVMERAAEVQRESADYVAKIEQVRQEAVLDPGSLGKILPSEEIVSGFREATQDTKETLAVLEESCAALADTLVMVAEHFRQVDEAVADRFTTMMGG